MKKIAVIVASGIGSRMGLDIPKQFVRIEIKDNDKVIDKKEVLTYTLDSFQNHDLIDEIVVVTLKDYIDHVKNEAIANNITKLKNIVVGGDTVQESIRNGVYSLDLLAKDEDIVIIHDGVRPIVDDEVLTDVIQVCEKFGNAVSSLPYNEQIFVIDDSNPNITTQYINRDKLRRVSTPQAYKYAIIRKAYEEAFAKKIGIYPPSYTNNMMVDLGYALNFAKGSDKNIKLTTIDDITTFKSFKLSEYQKQKVKVKEYKK